MTSPAVVVAGDALVDLTPTTSVTGHVAYEPHPGGSCLNVAVGLGRLGVPVGLLARVSEDAFGTMLRDHLADAGVAEDRLVATTDPTTLGAVHLVDGQAAYSFHAGGAADRGLTDADLDTLPALPEGTALHLGSIALVLEPAATTLEGLLLRESGRRLVSLDPNVRPGLVADRDAYLRRLRTWVAASDLVKVSDEDLAWIEPDRDEETVVADWLAPSHGHRGPALVVVTHGGEGAHAWTRTTRARVGTPRVDVVDTVGAGDAFTSGLLAALHRCDRLRRTALETLDATGLTALLSHAAAVAADTCTRPGADPPRRTPGARRA